MAYGEYVLWDCIELLIGVNRRISIQHDHCNVKLNHISLSEKRIGNLECTSVGLAEVSDHVLSDTFWGSRFRSS